MKTILQSSMHALMGLMISFNAFAADLSIGHNGKRAEEHLPKGLYSTPNCKPANPEEGCPYIEIRTDPNNSAKLIAEGSLSGSDIINHYAIAVSFATAQVGGLTVHPDGTALLIIRLRSEGTGRTSTIFYSPIGHTLTNPKYDQMLVLEAY